MAVLTWYYTALPTLVSLTKLIRRTMGEQMVKSVFMCEKMIFKIDEVYFQKQ
jgi:hypothetical protein